MEDGEKMISSEEREGESEERNFISFNCSLNVQYFPLHLKCCNETQYSLLSGQILISVSIHGIQETVGRKVNVRNQLLYKSLGKAVDLCSTSETRNKKSILLSEDDQWKAP